MKKIIEYQCEICHRKYPTADGAVACEARGVFDPSIYPTGLMYQYYHHDYVGIFAIVPWEPDRIYMHHANLVSWACRAPGYPGDSLGEEKCSSNDYLYSNAEGFKQFNRWSHITEKHLNGPEFKRMVKFLKRIKIKPTYYDAKGILYTV